VATSASASSGMRETRMGRPLSQAPGPARGEEFVAHGVVDDPGHQGSIFLRILPSRLLDLSLDLSLFQPQGDAKMGNAVGEVGVRPGVHVPAKLGFEPLARALFAVDSVVRKGLGQAAANQLLHGPVGHRHRSTSPCTRSRRPQ